MHSKVPEYHSGLPVGQHNGLYCPDCESPDNALSLNVGAGGIAWLCHRASCGSKGVSGAMRGAAGALASMEPPKDNSYKHESRNLAPEDVKWFRDKFGIMQVIQFKRATPGRYLLPVWAADGTRRGWISRHWADSPYAEGLPKTDAPKTLHYMDKPGIEGISFYRRAGGARDENWPLVIVEDIISAIKTHEVGFETVALCGTGFNQTRVREISSVSRRIVIALDADATGLAFAHARKWGQAFDYCRVAVLEKDLKDCPKAAILDILT